MLEPTEKAARIAKHHAENKLREERALYCGIDVLNAVKSLKQNVNWLAEQVGEAVYYGYEVDFNINEFTRVVKAANELSDAFINKELPDYLKDEEGE